MPKLDIGFGILVTTPRGIQQSGTLHANYHDDFNPSGQIHPMNVPTAKNARQTTTVINMPPPPNTTASALLLPFEAAAEVVVAVVAVVLALVRIAYVGSAVGVPYNVVSGTSIVCGPQPDELMALGVLVVTAVDRPDQSCPSTALYQLH